MKTGTIQINDDEMKMICDRAMRPSNVRLSVIVMDNHKLIAHVKAQAARIRELEAAMEKVMTHLEKERP